MLDINFEFSPTFIMKNNNKIDELVITSCKIHQFSNERLWSGFEEETFHCLNSDSGYGVLDFEIGFTGYKGQPYPKIYTKCFRLLTNDKLLIKPMKTTNYCSSSKVNNNGEMIIPIRYWFTNESQIEKIVACKQILIESFFALDYPRNTYAFAIQMEKDENGNWQCEMANTYRRKKYENIKKLLD